MAIFSEGGTSSPDIYIGLLLITCSLTAMVLNVMVFIFNSRKSRSVPKFLFQVLSVAGFLTGAVIGPFMVQSTLKSGEPVSRENINKGGDVPGALKAYGVTSWFLNQSPGFVASVMAVCRYVQIKRPFQKISFRFVVCFVIGVSVCNVVSLCGMLLQPGITFSYTVHNLFPENKNIFSTSTGGTTDMIAYTFMVLIWTATLGQVGFTRIRKVYIFIFSRVITILKLPRNVNNHLSAPLHLRFHPHRGAPLLDLQEPSSGTFQGEREAKQRKDHAD